VIAGTSALVAGIFRELGRDLIDGASSFLHSADMG
jgi:hypothetical protein